MSIYTVTLNSAVDITVGEYLYKKEGVLPTNSKMIPAGKGINVSRALSCVGVCSTAIAIIGARDLEFFMSIKNDRITPAFVLAEGETRKNLTITNCEDEKERHEKHGGFTIGLQQVEEIKEILIEKVVEGDIVAFCGSLPNGANLNLYRELILLTRKLGAYPLLDTSNEELLEGIAASPYMIKPNEYELKYLARETLENFEREEDAMRQICCEYDINYMLLSEGENGARLYSYEEDKMLEMEAIPALHKIVSTVGCGDSMVAGFIYGLINHLSAEDMLTEAMKFANANLYTEVPCDLEKFGLNGGDL